MKSLKMILAGQSPHLALLALAGLANAACILMLNHGYAGMLDAALAKEPESISATALMLALTALVNGIINVVEYMLYGRIAENAGHRLRLHTARRLLETECSALHLRHSGDSFSRANQGLLQATDWLRSQFCPIVIEAAVLLVVLVAMATINWKLTAAAFAIVPPVTYFAIRASRPIRRAASEQQASLAGLTVLVKSVADAFPIIKIFDMTAMMSNKFDKSSDESVKLAIRSNSIERMLMSINGFSALIPMGILLGTGAALVMGGAMTAGTLLAYINLSNFIVSPLMNLPNRISAARAFAANLARVAELNDDPLEAQRPMNRRLVSMQDGNTIELRNVDFEYDKGSPVLHNVSLSIPLGARIALVGPSGCGKSTVIKLLAALHMPARGSVSVQGCDTRKWNVAKLRSQMAVVMQDPFLFPGSMMENITCGHEMPEAQVMDACRAAGLTELIASLPGGLSTDVGEHGAKLSGGQKQRVAIARAIARDAPILLLDEATSALDAITERGIQEALETLMRGRTTLIVTHRLSTIRNADRIYCMCEGEITAWGTHEELMVKGGYYAGLIKMQNGDSRAADGGECA